MTFVASPKFGKLGSGAFESEPGIISTKTTVVFGKSAPLHLPRTKICFNQT